MMQPERWSRLKRLLEPALELPPHEVPAYLEQACRGDAELRDEAERLLRACRLARDSLTFLDSPALEFMAPLLELAAPLPAMPELAPGAEVGPYVVERSLGAGGMGAVYLARDPRLGRSVALKLLPPWVPVDEAAVRRVTREAVAASQLDHPNIQTVYEIGRTVDGRPYIAMAYYEGETLQALIDRGPLEIPVVVDIAGQIADGLAAAHAHGIVHRDIKPSNVMITPAGVAKILDFGAAKVPGHGLPQTGVVTGTVPFMSPEQTRWETVDSRTDIWSLGVVLYAMLTGRTPFTARDPDDLIRAIRRDEPEPLRSMRPGVPTALARIVDRCLRKEREGRFQDAGSLAGALRQARGLPGKAGRGRRPPWRSVRLVASAGLLTVLVGASVIWVTTRPGTGAAVEAGVGALNAVRLAVLPLADSSPGDEVAYMADGLTEDLISRFSQLGTLRVIALSSVLPYVGSTDRIDEIGHELGVGALLTGTVRATADQVELRVRLVDVESREPLWTQDRAVGLGDLPALQNQIVEGAAAALELRLRTGERRLLSERGTESPEAYTLYLQGRHFLAKLETPGASQEARRYFELALDRDATFALAWASLAGAYHQLAVQGAVPSGDAMPRAREAANRALALNPDLAEAHSARAAALSWYDWNTEDAEQHFLRALELEPSSARIRRSYAVHLRNHGRFEEALAMMRAAAELDPLSPGGYLQEGTILYMAHQPEEAISRFRQLLTVNPQFTATYFYMALTYTQMGLYDEALDALQATDPEAGQLNTVTIRGYVLARLGQRAGARRSLARLDSLYSDRPLSFSKAVIHTGLGELDRALGLLEQGVEERAWQMQLLGVEPVFDPLRPRPRFQALLRRLNLEPRRS
jgi:TolB-like protein/Tfp pilus assembly protein PilF